ncbi:hypothetical protein DIPPA_25490 [Diplonema papillatum]|nr:hypothetical protein DIPPA_25490 [Diplonema papillatum]|eukprot:gene15475-23639_t
MVDLKPLKKPSQLAKMQTPSPSHRRAPAHCDNSRSVSPVKQRNNSAPPEADVQRPSQLCNGQSPSAKYNSRQHEPSGRVSPAPRDTNEKKQPLNNRTTGKTFLLSPRTPSQSPKRPLPTARPEPHVNARITRFPYIEALVLGMAEDREKMLKRRQKIAHAAEAAGEELPEPEAAPPADTTPASPPPTLFECTEQEQDLLEHHRQHHTHLYLLYTSAGPPLLKRAPGAERTEKVVFLYSPGQGSTPADASPNSKRSRRKKKHRLPAAKRAFAGKKRAKKSPSKAKPAK